MFGMVYCSWMYLTVWSRFWNWNTKAMVNQWASLSPGVFCVKACKVSEKLVGKDCIGFSLSIKSRLTEEGLACRCIQFWDNFHPAWPKQQCSPLLLLSLTTNCETISLANIQLPTFIGDILSVSRKYLSFRRIFVEAAEKCKKSR